MRQSAYTKKMITNYPTCNTAENRSVRYQTLLPQGALFMRNLEAYLHVNLLGSQRLLSRWNGIFNATTNPAVDDSPAIAGLSGIAAQIGKDLVGEQQSWSPSIRRRRVKLKP